MRLRLVTALVASIVASISCGGSKQRVEVTLLDRCHLGSSDACDGSDPSPSDLALCGDDFCSGKAVWAQLAIFPDGCPSDDTLAEGDVTGAVRVLAAEAGQPLPALGELDEARFGFAGLLRSADCSVVGLGCTEASLATIRKVRVEMRPVSGRGICRANDTCQRGACVGSAGDASDTCLPVLVTAGELPARDDPRSVVSGPGIVATETGYLIGYREDVPNGGARIRLGPVDDDGVLGAPVEEAIDSCGDIVGGGGIGMAMSVDQGLLVTAHPACSGRGAGASFITFARNGAILDVQTYAGAGDVFSLAKVHAVAEGRTRNSFELAYVSDGAAHRLALSGARPEGGALSIFPDASASFAQIASSIEGIAHLVGVASNAQTTALFGMADWDADPMVSRGAAGAFGAVIAHEHRAIAAMATRQGGLRWEGRTVDGSSFGAGALESGGPFAAVDVVTVGEHVVMAAGRRAGIWLASIGRASETLASQPSVIAQHGPSLGGVSLSEYDGDHLAMASARRRFALTWPSGQGGEGPVGGFALFECSR